MIYFVNLTTPEWDILPLSSQSRDELFGDKLVFPNCQSRSHPAIMEEEEYGQQPQSPEEYGQPLSPDQPLSPQAQQEDIDVVGHGNAPQGEQVAPVPDDNDVIEEAVADRANFDRIADAQAPGSSSLGEHIFNSEGGGVKVEFYGRLPGNRNDVVTLVRTDTKDHLAGDCKLRFCLHVFRDVNGGSALLHLQAQIVVSRRKYRHVRVAKNLISIGEGLYKIEDNAIYHIFTTHPDCYIADLETNESDGLIGVLARASRYETVVYICDLNGNHAMRYASPVRLQGDFYKLIPSPAGFKLLNRVDSVCRYSHPFNKVDQFLQLINFYLTPGASQFSAVMYDVDFMANCPEFARFTKNQPVEGVGNELGRFFIPIHIRNYGTMLLVGEEHRVVKQHIVVGFYPNKLQSTTDFLILLTEFHAHLFDSRGEAKVRIIEIGNLGMIHPLTNWAFFTEERNFHKPNTRSVHTFFFGNGGGACDVREMRIGERRLGLDPNAHDSHVLGLKSSAGVFKFGVLAKYTTSAMTTAVRYSVRTIPEIPPHENN